MLSFKTLVVQALALVTPLCLAADDLMTSRFIEEARQWQLTDRDDMAADLWRRVLLTDPKHPEALGKLRAIEARSGNTKDAQVNTDQANDLKKSVPGSKTKPLNIPAAAAPSKPASALPIDFATPTGAIEVTIRDRSKPVVVKEPKLGTLQTAAASKTRGATRSRLEKLVQLNPGELRYQLALARHLAYRESTRREAIGQLGSLYGSGQSSREIQQVWRRELLALHAEANDQTLFNLYLERFPGDRAVAERLRALGGLKLGSMATVAQVSNPAGTKNAEASQPAPKENNPSKAKEILRSVRALGLSTDDDLNNRSRLQLEQAMLLDPTNSEIRLELAEFYRRVGLLDAAASLVENVLGQAPENPEALMARVVIYSSQNSWALGLETLERIPQDKRTFASAAIQRRLWIQTQLLRSRQFFAAGKFSQAAILMEQAATAAVQDESMMPLVAVGWSVVGQSSKALDLIRKIVSVTPAQAVEPRIRYAEVLLNAQQDAELAPLLEDLSAPGRLNPSQQDELNRIILGYTLRVTEALRESGRLAEAAEVISPALQRFDDTRLLLSMARLYGSAGNLDAALELTERVIDREPVDLAHRLYATEIALARGDLDSAQKHANAALELAPDHPRALSAAGRIEKIRGNTTQALMYFKQAQAMETKRGEFSTSGQLALRLVSDTPAAPASLQLPSRVTPGGRSGLLPIPIYSPDRDKPAAGGIPKINPPSGLSPGSVPRPTTLGALKTGILDVISSTEGAWI